MSGPGNIFAFCISVKDFDATQLRPNARRPGTDAFRTAVTELLQREYEPFGGTVKIAVTNEVISVTWTSDADAPDPLEVSLQRLRSGDYESGVKMLRSLLRAAPDNPDILFNLGMALSDLGELEEAERLLRGAVRVAPQHVNALVALGVALVRRGQTGDAVEVLRDAVRRDPSNGYAHRNLGGCLLKQSKVPEAREHLERATSLIANDAQAWIGLAQAAEASGDARAADTAYLKVIELDPRGQLGELARQARTRLAHASFRDKAPGGGFRPDAMMYCLHAIQQFRKLPRAEVQKITFEIALLGRGGLDINNSERKYALRSLPGDYSGLQLVCMMYVGGKIVMPEQDMGIDLRREYDAAVAAAGDRSQPE